ncbi:uncharacterized protein ACA1_159050 [Acanthamoeba castellanii str. Neff]|uniref:Nucleotide-diphospho-sugar transferase domain-containing protein n=1 Tax=Acanthamoeba castellanii (strain ATCC 30010 / Neff) TaxID=1257118 RepID=L8H9F0_ACACF|nr:uncharacterized protein ACA1_159050 [Acanthamoeba castellanii str. Neff]ELR22109.1 hypothetical protein ACA1_159050 [Acanthamoeba castellanii str. Neff]
MRGVVVLGPRGVLTVAAVLLLQSGIIGYLLYRSASGLDDCTDLPGLGRPLPLAFLPPQQQPPPLGDPDDGRGPRDAPPPTFEKKPVVMGMATGYRWDALRNFVISLRYTNFAGDVVLFVSQEAQSDDDLMQRLRFYNVTTVVVSSKFPYFEKGSLPHLMVERLLFPPMPELKAMNRRFHIMQLWLTAYGSFYDYVLITDTRDVVFQKDPFDWAHPNNLFGDDVWEHGADAVREAGETVDRDIFDQAVHMYIVYRLDWHDRLVRLENARSPVLTVGSFGEFKTQSPVLNDDGLVANVLHQYDRYTELVQTFDTRLRFLERQSFNFHVPLTAVQVRS